LLGVSVKGAGPSDPQKWTLYLRRDGWTYSDEIWYGNTWWSSVFLWVTAPRLKGASPRVPKIFWTPLRTMARYGLSVLKVPLNIWTPTNQPTYAQTVSPTAMTFAVLRAGVACFYRGSVTPRTMGEGERSPSVPRSCGVPPTWAHTTKFCTVVKLYARQILRDRLRMLTRDLFAVANLLD